MVLSEKQKQILTCLIFGDMDSDDILIEWLTINQLLEVLPYFTSKESMHFSLRALRKKELIESCERRLQNGRWQTPIMPTQAAIDLIPVLKVDPVTVSMEEDEEEIVFEGF